MAKSPAVEIAQEQQEEGRPEILTLTSGVRVRVKPVSSQFRDMAQARIPDPEVPMWHDPAEDRDVPNPDDPAYRKALEDVALKRSQAVTDALVMFGVELVDGMPQDGDWLERLQFMAKHAMIELDGFDLDCPIDREYLYKRYVVIADADWAYLWPALNEKRQAALEHAAQLFRRKGAGNADSGS